MAGAAYVVKLVGSLRITVLLCTFTCCRAISPMSDGGAGGGSATDGEGTRSPSRRKKKRLDEDMLSKKDTLDQVCNTYTRSLQMSGFGCNQHPDFDVLKIFL